MQSLSPKICISIAGQRLDLFDGDQLVQSFFVSTSAHGIGSEEGSLRTPIGAFTIAEKIGDGAPVGMVFRSRQPTGEYGNESDPEDLVQTRILWLDGLEPHNANTYSRYIYIHGTNHESAIGRPASHGCIRMRNADVVSLYDQVTPGTQVFIRP
jgi:L,D-transpeptidase YbiS